MIDREKISPLLIIGIGLIILSIFGVIFFTLPSINTVYSLSPRSWSPVIGIFIGGMFLFLGIYYSLPSNRSKGIFLISIGSLLLIYFIFLLYLIIPIIALYPYSISVIFPLIISSVYVIGNSVYLIGTGIKHISENKRKIIPRKKYIKQTFVTNPDCQHCALARNLGLKECPNCGKKLTT